jgi:glycerol-3-phosphate acyltransferase PlsY
MLSLIIIIMLSYLIGSIPTAIIISKKFFGFDIRTKGSGNAGGTNAFRVLGWKAGIAVILFDVGKGVIATLLFSKIRIGGEPVLGLEPVIVQLIAGILAIVGHIWTIFAGFKGGKGVGTAAGVFVVLFPIALLICFVIWAVILLTGRIMSVASMTAAICLPLTLFLLQKYFDYPVHPVLFILSIIMAALIIITHRSNIKRLINGTENRFAPIWARKKSTENQS